MLGKTKVWLSVGAFLLTSTTCGAEVMASSSAESSLALSETSRSLSESRIDHDKPLTLIAQGGHSSPQFQDKLTGVQLVNALRGGGYVIFFRHVQTEVDYADQVFARMGHCVTQRVLGEEGWQQARRIGQAFQQLKIPVGKVFSSEYCRAWQTADLAFGRYEKVPGLNFAPAEEYSEAQKLQMRNGIMPLLTAVPAAGANTVIVGHDDVFEAATEIYPEPQGVAFVVQPDGAGKFEVIARIPPDQWLQLNR
jgi:phosphohistidine phosphatase SixA